MGSGFPWLSTQPELCPPVTFRILVLGLGMQFRVLALTYRMLTLGSISSMDKLVWHYTLYICNLALGRWR